MAKPGDNVFYNAGPDGSDRDLDRVGQLLHGHVDGKERIQMADGNVEPMEHLADPAAHSDRGVCWWDA